MKNLTQIKPNKGATHKRKRVGRGNGSGHGTFSCRGMNGQSARSGGRRRPGFEGGQTPFYRRMPKLKGFNNPNYINYQVVNIDKLNVFKENDTVNKEVLLAKGIISKKQVPVKLLGNGELTVKLKITVDSASNSAAEKIKKAKGELITLIKEKTPKADKPKKAKKEEVTAEKPAKEVKAEEPVVEEKTEEALVEEAKADEPTEEPKEEAK